MADSGMLTSVGNIITDIVYSPLNLSLLLLCLFLIYKFFLKRDSEPTPTSTSSLPILKRDFTVQQLREYDGTGKDGRVLVAVNGKVFDVTRGKSFYGPGGPYGIFAGRDASRGLGTFSLTPECIKDEYDDISDLDSMQKESILEWEMQFTEKYLYVGRLLKPGETPTEYTDAEDDPGSESERARVASGDSAAGSDGDKVKTS